MPASTDAPDPPGSAVDVLLDAVLDPGSWSGWDGVPLPPPAPHDTPAYRAELAAARERSGADEAVRTGEGTVGGHRVAVLAGEFGFLGGSIGVATAERVLAAVARATAEELPLLAAPASGGTRMQEGTTAFLRMAAISAALSEHRAAGLPYLVHLRHPTTGGVLASWGSLGQLTSAEPGALIGFLGPRAVAAVTGAELPDDVQRAETLLAEGVVDAVVDGTALRDVVVRVLDHLAHTAADGTVTDAGSVLVETVGPTGDGGDAWDAVQRTRRADRPGLRALLRAADDVVLLGDGAVRFGLARFGPTSAVVLGHDRSSSAPLGPAALRGARRVVDLAGEWGLPLVTVVDTAGAELSEAAERGGLAREIARLAATLAGVGVPTVSVLLGQGGGGAASAFLPADRVLAAEHAWLAPLPPEGASAILHRTPDRAGEVARAHRIRAVDLRATGLVDRIVAEHDAAGDAGTGAAADAPEAFAARVAAAVAAALTEVVAVAADERRRARHARLARMGTT